jgi:hypothetical protein
VALGVADQVAVIRCKNPTSAEQIVLFHNCPNQRLENAVRLGKHDMAVTPKHYRAARLALPRLPLPAIIAFAVAGLGGALFLARTGVTMAEGTHSYRSANDIPVYSARAVPFDSPREDAAQRNGSIVRALTATQTQVHRAETSEVEGAASVSGPTLLAEANRELRGFAGFSDFAGANTYLAVTGTTFGISAQTAPSGFAAPDAETVTASPVPEASTWWCGGALLVLVAARGLHASWHRKHRRDQ